MNPDKRHPDGAEDDLRQLAEVFRRHAPAEPADEAWARALDGIARATRRPRKPPARWPWAAAAGLLLALGLGYALWPAGGDDDEPFPVASASEIHVVSVNPEDADRLALGQPLLGAFELAALGEIEVVAMEPNPDDGRTPVVRQDGAVPWIVGEP